MKKIWIIEIFDNGKWEPTIGAGLTKKDATMFMRAEWKRTCLDDKFRVKKYLPADE